MPSTDQAYRDTQTVRIPRDLVASLTKEAERLEVSLAWLITRILRENVDRLPTRLTLTDGSGGGLLTYAKSVASQSRKVSGAAASAAGSRSGLRSMDGGAARAGSADD